MQSIRFPVTLLSEPLLNRGQGGQKEKGWSYFVNLAEEYYARVFVGMCVGVFVCACARARKREHDPKPKKIGDSMEFMFTSDMHTCSKRCIQMWIQKMYFCSSNPCERWYKIIINVRLHSNNTTPLLISFLA